MVKYLKPKLKVVRRLGDIPGFTNKIRKFKDSLKFKVIQKVSQYKLQLNEKQKLRYFHCLNEKQFSNYVSLSKKKKGSSGKVLLSLLIMRIDNLLFEVGFSTTLFFSRQIINHGHILLMKKRELDKSYIVRKITFPSYSCKKDMIVLVDLSTVSQNLIRKVFSTRRSFFYSPYLVSHKYDLKFKIKSFADGNSPVVVIKELLVIEYYSRKI